MTASDQKALAPAAGRKIARPPLGKIYGVQAAMVLLVSILAIPLDGVIAWSIVLGGLISVVPNAYFARQVFRFAGAKYAREVARAFYLGESGKYLATMLLFAATFLWVKPLNVLVLFMAYLAMTLVNAFLVARFRNAQR